jgi:P2 family phage contractile tail tube protein
MAISVNKLYNANVYVNGTSFLGRAEEVTLPKVQAKMIEHKALGMVGVVETPAGIEKMEAKIKWSSLYPEVLEYMANPHKALSIQVRASLETYDSTGRIAEAPVVAYMTVQFKNFPGIGFKHQDNAEVETDMVVSYYKLQIDGEDYIEVDAYANIWKVKGKDILEQYKANIGT